MSFIVLLASIVEIFYDKDSAAMVDSNMLMELFTWASGIILTNMAPERCHIRMAGFSKANLLMTNKMVQVT